MPTIQIRVPDAREEPLDLLVLLLQVVVTEGADVVGGDLVALPEEREHLLLRPREAGTPSLRDDREPADAVAEVERRLEGRERDEDRLRLLVAVVSRRGAA